MMVRVLPSSGAPLGCNTDDILLAHRMYRTAYEELPGLVSSVAVGDRKRAAAVSRYIADMSSSLHGHHTTEDALLWDTLEARAPACAAHVAQMRAEHEAMSAVLDRIDELVPAWRKQADAASRDGLASLLTEARSLLEGHLGEEETKILPVAEQNMAQQEWDRLGQKAQQENVMPPTRVFVKLGYLLRSQPPAEAERWMRESLPAPIRLAWQWFGRHQFEAERRQVAPDAA